MRNFLIALLIICIIGGGWFHFSRLRVCQVPIEYKIGSLDIGFNLPPSEAKAAILAAEKIWEDATGRELFVYTGTSGAFPINFIFDERQESTLSEANSRDGLDKVKEQSDRLLDRHNSLVKEYETLKNQFEQQNNAYNRRRLEHNRIVADWNEKGGAPPEEFERLQKTQSELSAEQAKLDRLNSRLVQLVNEINQTSQSHRDTAADFNDRVGDHNSRFGQLREFTQGDYQGDKINIYQFSDELELKLVIAHELGHALGLEHTDNEASIMYHLMGSQSVPPTLTAEDKAELTRVCGE